MPAKPRGPRYNYVVDLPHNFGVIAVNLAISNLVRRLNRRLAGHVRIIKNLDGYSLFNIPSDNVISTVKPESVELITDSGWAELDKGVLGRLVWTDADGMGHGMTI